MPGRWIVITAWVTLGLFAVTIIPDAAGIDAFDNVSVAVSLALFLAGLVLWMYAFGVAVVRSARGDDIGLGALFFLQGSAPREVRRPLYAVLAVSVVLALVTVYANAFAVLEPVFPLALMSLWAARYGTFPARADATRVASRPRPQPGGAR